VLPAGFDPEWSSRTARQGLSLRPLVAFNSPEAAERAFGIVLGKIRPSVDDRPDLIYARMNHPKRRNFLEEQMVPLDRGAKKLRRDFQFRHGLRLHCDADVLERTDRSHLQAAA